MDKLFDFIDDLKDSVDEVKKVVDVVQDAAEYVPDVVDTVTDVIDTMKDVSSDVIEKLEDHAISMGATPTENMMDKDTATTAKPAKKVGSPITPKKEYFSDDELRCKHCGALVFDEDFRKKLNVARELAGNPWTVTSGYRCAEHNANVGGVNGSAHTKGLAVDIYAPTSDKKYEIIVKAIVAGITRIGVANEFIHLDCDPDKPQNVVWLY